MQTARKDILQQKIAKELENRERVLRETYKDLKSTVLDKDNLDSVLNDYHEHYNFIIAEKRKQQTAFKTILDHLEKLNSGTVLSEQEKNKIRNDKLEILERIGFIEGDIKSI